MSIRQSKEIIIERAHYKLDVWRKSVNLITEVYALTSSFPEVEKFGLVSQIRRASVSIPSNIAEGATRDTNKEFNNFLSIAKGSASELETQLIICEKLKYIEKVTLDRFIKKIEDITKMLVGLKKSIKSQ